MDYDLQVYKFTNMQAQVTVVDVLLYNFTELHSIEEQLLTGVPFHYN